MSDMKKIAIEILYQDYLKKIDNENTDYRATPSPIFLAVIIMNIVFKTNLEGFFLKPDKLSTLYSF